MMNSALTNGGKGMKRTRDGIPKAQGLLEWQGKQQNTSNSGTNTIIELIGKYNDFCIVKEHCVVEQIFDLQFIVVELEKHKNPLPENFQMGMLIAKLPLSLRHFATSLWEHEKKMCMDDLVASITEENARMENIKTNNQNLNNEENDIWACWACRKAGNKSNRCRRPKNAIQMVKEIILNDATASYEVEKKVKVKDELSTVQELNRVKQNDSTPTQEMCNRKYMGSSSGSLPCWSCRKMGYLTDMCTRRSNKTEKFLQKKRHRSAVMHTKKISKPVSRSCWTCRKKSYMAVCCECQKNIIDVQSLQLQN